MIVGIGVDIVEIARIEKIVKKFGEKFCSRNFCQAEVDAANQSNDYIIYYAKRFAAKEAFSKALGTGIHATVALKDISTLDDQFSEPYILLSGNAKKTVENMRHQLRKKIVNIQVSLSSEKQYAHAFVILEML